MYNLLLYTIIVVVSFLTLLSNTPTINMLYIATPATSVVLLICVIGVLFMPDEEIAKLKMPKSPKAVRVIKHMMWVFATLSSAAVGLFFISTCWLISYLCLVFVSKTIHHRQEELKAKKEDV